MIVRHGLRAVLTTAQQLRRLFWFASRPHVRGAHAIPITREGRVVLVRLRYAPGWRLPGGGIGRNEDARSAVLRELREEIGLLSHAEVEHVRDIDEIVDFRSDLASLFIVRDVEYHSRWSLEVEAVTEADPDDLPHETSPRTLRWLADVRHQLDR